MRILILGSKGQLGRCLKDQFKKEDHDVFYFSREQIDITNFDLTKKKLVNISPDLVINAAAYTAVDEAEKYQEISNLVNHIAVEYIARICRDNDVWLIHFSTDYVFDGMSKIPYKETDKTNPKSAYGESKLKGELKIQSSGCKYIIIRTAWVFSEYGDNFLKTMLRLGTEHNELNIVGDQIGCPTYAQDIAKSVVKIISRINNMTNNGIYHYCGCEEYSWYGFAKEIFKQTVVNNLTDSIIVNSIETSDYPMLAERPAFSVLNSSKIRNDFDVTSSKLNEGIKQALANLSL